MHETDRPHFFSADEHSVIREWMKALMKATIDRDYTSASVLLYLHLLRATPNEDV